MKKHIKTLDMRKMNLKKKTKSERQKLIDICDDLFREIIRKRDRVCQKTGKNYDLQVAHFISRVNKHLRWEPDNACLLNKGIHYYWAHVRHQQFRDFFIQRIGKEKVEWLEMQDKISCKSLNTSDLKAIEFCLRQTLKEMETPKELF